MLGRAKNDWDQDFVKEQSSLLTRDSELVKERVAKSCERNKATYDRKVKPSKPIKISSHVLLRKQAFKGRHKLADVFERDPYVVVWINEHNDVYRIRPLKGGPERVVNRKLLRLDPFAESETENESDEGSDEDSDWEALRTEPLADQPLGQDLQGVSNVEVGEHPILGGSTSGHLRSSQRTTKGKHSNPYRLPSSAMK